MELKKIIIGSDHGGLKLKLKVISYLSSFEFMIEDVGTKSEESCNYPFFAHLVAQKVSKEIDSIGILICSSGQGMAITANKYEGIRAALCWDKKISFLARAHNDSNILCLPGMFISYNNAIIIIDTFLSTKFENGRHYERICLIDK